MIRKDLITGEVVSFFTSEQYTRISILVLAAGAVTFAGVKSSIPPNGNAGSIRLIPGNTVDFVIGPGDTIYVGNVGAATSVSMIVSPLPWPKEKGDGLIQAAEMMFFEDVPSLAVQPDPVRVYAASEYVEVGFSIRINKPFNGLFAFNSTMRDAFVCPVTLYLVRFVMSPGDQFFIAAAAAPIDVNIVVSPCPWWNTSTMRGLF